MNKMITSVVLAAMMIAVTGCATTGGSSSQSSSNSSQASSSKTSTSSFDKAKSITVISREEGSGTRGAFVELTGVEAKDASGNKVDHTTKEAEVVSKTDVMLTSVASDTYAIGYVSLGSLNTTVKAVNYEGIAATAENVKNGTYKLARPFLIVTGAKVDAVAQDFITFITSAEGQKVITDNKYIQSVATPAAYKTTAGLTGKIVVAGSSSVSPVMEKLAEAYKVINKGVNIEIQTSDSSSGIKAATDGTCQIGMSSRDLKDTEKTALKDTKIAIDGIAVIVNTKNPIANITKTQTASIFTGETSSWGGLK